MLTTLCLCGALASVASACPYAGRVPAQLTGDQASASVFCLVNHRRAHNGRRRLQPNPLLKSAADGHSTAMDTHNFFSHDSTADGSPVSRIRATGYLTGYGTWGIGEDIHWGRGRRGSPKATVAAWMASPMHRRVMLMPSFREIGVGVTIGSPAGSGVAGIYTADFGYRR